MKPLPQKYAMGSDWLAGQVCCDLLDSHLVRVYTPRPPAQRHVLRLYCCIGFWGSNALWHGSKCLMWVHPETCYNMMTLVLVCWFTLHDLALIMSKSLRQIVREKICLLRDLTLLLVWVLTCVTLWNTICRRGRDVRDSSYWKVE